MNNRKAILMLIDKSANAFGELIGTTNDTKLKVIVTIIHDTIEMVWGINSIQLTSKELVDSIIDKKIDVGDTHLLFNLLWIQAETLSQLEKPVESLRAYENALQLIQWRSLRVVQENDFKKNITRLKSMIRTLKQVIDLDNEYRELIKKGLLKNSFFSN